MKSLSKRRNRRTNTARRARRRKTRKVGGEYGLRLEIFKDICTVLDKLLEEMKVILREETYPAYESKTYEFKALNERLREKSEIGTLSTEDIRNYQDKYIAWRDLFDHDVYRLDVARLRDIGALDERRRPRHFIYIMNKIIEKFVNEVVNLHDPVIAARIDARYQEQRVQAQQRRSHELRAYLEQLARDRRWEQEHQPGRSV